MENEDLIRQVLSLIVCQLLVGLPKQEDHPGGRLELPEKEFNKRMPISHLSFHTLGSSSQLCDSEATGSIRICQRFVDLDVGGCFYLPLITVSHLETK